MGRRMKWISKKWNRLSATKRIFGLLLAGTVLILSITVGLRFWDQSRQKPRVWMALKQLAEEAADQTYSFVPLFQVIQGGNIKQEGYVNFERLDTKVLEEKFAWLVDRTASSMQYQLAVQQKEGICSNKINYQIAEIGALDIESYQTKEKLIVRIPQIHNSYLRMDTHNIKSQYMDSFLYEVLGEKLVVPESDFSVEKTPIFPTEKELKKVNMSATFLEEYKGKEIELWKKIQVKKESETKQIGINGVYEDCSVFHLLLPTELVEWYLGYILSDVEIEVKAEWVDLWLYMDDDNHIHCIEMVLEPERKGTVYPTQILCYLRGEERLLNKIQIELTIRKETERMEFWIDFERQLEEEKQKIFISVSQINPKKIEFIRTNFTMDLHTGESHIEYKLNLPLIVSDGEHTIQTLEQVIKEPEGEIVDLFELDLIGFLKFSRDFNFALFQ